MIEQLQKDIDRLLDLVEQADDPEIKDRLFQMIQRKMKDLKTEHQNDQQAAAAVDALDEAISRLVNGNIGLAQSRLDIEKLRLKLGFLHENQPRE